MLTALFLSGCGGSKSAAEGSTFVSMYDNQFNPPVVRIPVGNRVTWINTGRNPHNAVADDSSWSTEEAYGNIAMPAAAETSVRFSKPGVYPYFCTFHGAPGGGGMSGVVVVGDVEYSLPGTGKLEPVAKPSGITRHVPGEYPTIQAGVDAAAPGDLILVERGIYREEVTVTTPSLVIRGVDRNEVIIDGEFVRGNGIIALADGVAIENMTARNALLNGFYWTDLTGYRASYLTAYNNGDYGIYAFGATDGLIEHSYASGSPDAGFYVGQCQPCRTVIRDVVAERSALGYSGTNSGGEMYIVSSIFRNNGAGIVPNSLDLELHPPERATTIAANLVIGNNYAAPTKPLQVPAFNNGIIVAGGVENRIERNVIIGHKSHGIFITWLSEDNFWPARDNIVRNNFVRRSGRADLALGGPRSKGNCFEGNQYRTSAPPGLERFHGCGGLRLPLGWDLLPAIQFLWNVHYANGDRFTSPDYRTEPAPPAQPNMPGGAEAPVRPAIDVFAGLHFDVNAAQLPAEAERFLAGGPDAITDGALPPEARVREMGMLGALLWRWTYYLPGVSLLLAIGLAVRRRVRPDGKRASLAARLRLGVLLVLAGTVLTLLVALLGGWLLSGGYWLT